MTALPVVSAPTGPQVGSIEFNLRVEHLEDYNLVPVRRQQADGSWVITGYCFVKRQDAAEVQL